MAKATDILLDSTGDLPIERNDFTIGFSDDQHIEDCIRAYPGYWKQYYTAGVGIKAYQNSSGQKQRLEKNIKLQLEADGYAVGSPHVVIGNKTQVYPNAERK